ncbi:hypothetical protein [Nocardia xishanensis]|uniref:hypothetical protein n=1 Tax=Nocardia xishanensis TaxID=238964 RepID=UPI000831359D|nr:hypothetical protein [Nocardia xishanensis]
MPANSIEVEGYAAASRMSSSGPLTEIRMVDIKALTVAETAFSVSGASGVTDARAEIVNRLVAQGDPLWSSLTRPSVV